MSIYCGRLGINFLWCTAEEEIEVFLVLSKRFDMKADGIFLCTFSAVLYCLAHSAVTKEDKMLNSNLHDHNWKDISPAQNRNFQNEWSVVEKFTYDNSVPSICNEKITKTKISKESVNKIRRQHILKSMPVLRNLTQEQILALYTQFKKMTHKFGDKTELVVALVNSIANLVQNSTTKYNEFNLNIDPESLNEEILTTPNDVKIHEKNRGFEGKMRDLQYNSTKIRSRARRKRSAAKLVHKLLRITSPNISEETNLKGIISSNVKLNTSNFASPDFRKESVEESNNKTTLSYEQIENYALAGINGTNIEINDEGEYDEKLPNPEELVAGPRYRISNKQRVSLFKGESKRKRMPSWIHPVSILQKKCERFTASMCIKADDYPLEQIMGSIRRHKNAMSALLAEYHDKAAELEYQEQLEEYQFNSKRREDGNLITPGGMCASVIRYARPQKARSASGEWKYIVNTGRHTQTLRLEKCSTPQESCSYLSHNYRSRCTQVYNYHRLLSWDKSRGLHVDIFKVPTCCSCQVDGYRETFPPLGGSKPKDYKDYTPVPNNNPYSAINDEIDYEDEDDDNSPIAYQFGNGLKSTKHDSFEHSELLLGSTHIKTEVDPPRLDPTVGSYLSPPSDTYISKVTKKNVRPSYYTSTNNAHNGRIRKPYKNNIPNESRADLVISETEQTNKEMKAYSAHDNYRIPPKRTLVYSGSNNETHYQTSGSFQLGVVPKFATTTEQTTKISHLQSFNPSTNASPGKEISNGKRINYSYHPIIDFFESQQKSGKAQLLTRSTATNVLPISSEISNSRKRKIGYGIAGVESSWLPVVVKT